MLSDSSRRGIMTAARIRDLVRGTQAEHQKDLLVLNRMAGPLQQDTAEEIKQNRLELAGVVPSDERSTALTATGRRPSSFPLRFRPCRRHGIFF